MFWLFEAFGTHVDLFAGPRLPAVEGLEGDREGGYVAHRQCYIFVSYELGYIWGCSSHGRTLAKYRIATVCVA